MEQSNLKERPPGDFSTSKPILGLRLLISLAFDWAGITISAMSAISPAPARGVCPRICLAVLLMILLQAMAQTASGAGSHRHERPQVKIEITGVKGRLLKNVKGFLRLSEKAKDPKFTIQWLKFLHQEAEEDIKKALEPFGYFTPEIKSELQQTGPNRWLARYHIDPGPRIRIKEVDVRLSGQGARDPDLLKLVRDFPLKAGDFLDQELYEKGKRAIIKSALSKGYMDVRAVVKKVLVDPEAKSAVIKLHIDTGAMYFLGKIRVHQDFMDPDLIERYIRGLKEGEPFTEESLLRLQQLLSDTGYFSLVDISPALDETGEDHRIPVDIYLEPASRHTLSFGIGYDTEVELNGSFHWHDARVNSLGHTSDIWTRLSMKQNMLKAAYWIPGSDPRTDRFGLSASLEQEDSADTERNTLDLEGGYDFLWSGWRSKLFSELKFERFRGSGESWTATKMFSVGGRVERSTIPKGPFPQRGWYLFSELRGSPGLYSDTAYMREHFRGRLLIPAGSRGRFLLRGRLGLAQVSKFSKYPDSLRFFAGGGESVRGYRWKRLGPEDSEGNVIGGRNVVSASCEFDYRVLERWVGALFVDAGNAFNGTLDKIYVGTGFGIRWLSPVGTVRLDLGWPVNEDGRSVKLSSVRFYFGFEITL